MKLYPNPANDVVNVSVNTNSLEDITLTVMDFTGRTVMVKVAASLNPGSNVISLETKGLQVGTYIVTGTGKNGFNYGILKLVVRH
jgi:hypothetical protein